MITGLSILLNSLGIIAVALMMAWMSRRLHQLSDDVTELQAAVDLIQVQHGQLPFFAARYDVDIERLDDAD